MIFIHFSFLKKMDFILLPKDFQMCKVTSFTWCNLEFAQAFLEKLEPFGWYEKETQLFAPNEWKIEIHRSVRPYFYDPTLWNPFYKIFFHQLLVCEIHVDVFAYNSTYFIDWKDLALDRIRAWVFMEEPILMKELKDDVLPSILKSFLIG